MGTKGPTPTGRLEDHKGAVCYLLDQYGPGHFELFLKGCRENVNKV